MVNYGKSENEPRMEANLRSELTEASVCSFESENGDGSNNLKCEEEDNTHDQKKCQPGQPKKRTNFTLLQRHELEKSFSQCQYLTPHSCRQLQELGINKQNLKVWFKNRRVKWRKEMRNCGLPERGKTACLMNNLSQAAALPPQRSASQPEVNRHNNEGTTMQGLPLGPSQSSALSDHSDVHHWLRNYSGETLSLRPTNFFYRERKGFVFQTAGSTRMQCSINSTNMMDNFGFMGNSSQSGMVLDDDDTRASLIRNGGRLFESNVKCGPYVMHEPIVCRQYQPSYLLRPPCQGTNLSQRSVIQQVCVTEQTTPNQKGDSGGDHNRPKQTVEPMNDVTVQVGENEWLLDDLMNIIAKEQLKEQNDL